MWASSLVCQWAELLAVCLWESALVHELKVHAWATVSESSSLLLLLLLLSALLLCSAASCVAVLCCVVLLCSAALCCCALLLCVAVPCAAMLIALLCAVLCWWMAVPQGPSIFPVCQHGHVVVFFSHKKLSPKKSKQLIFGLFCDQNRQLFFRGVETPLLCKKVAGRVPHRPHKVATRSKPLDFIAKKTTTRVTSTRTLKN